MKSAAGEPSLSSSWLPFSENPLGRVTLANEMRGKTRQVSRTPQWSLFGLFYVFEGRGWYRDTEGVETRMEPGTLVFYCPGVGHDYGPDPGTMWSEVFVLWEGPVFDLWLKSGLISPKRPVLRLKPTAYWRTRLMRFVPTRGDDPVAESLIKVAELQQFFADALRAGHADERSAADREFGAWACRLLDGADFEPGGVERVLAGTGMGYAVFRKRFRRVAGVSPADYVGRRRIREACELIARGGKTNKEVVQALAFSDEAHFSRRFKQAVGVTPSEFRQGVR